MSKTIGTTAILLTLVLSFVLSLVADQLTKIAAEKALLVSVDPTNAEVYEGTYVDVVVIGERPTPEAPNPFALRMAYLRNYGIAWGRLTDLQPDQRLPVLSMIAIVSVVIVSVLVRSLKSKTLVVYAGAALVVSGAIGNVIDRIRLGYVIDFVAVEWNVAGWAYRFPTFNVADIAICVGITMISLSQFLGRKR